MTAPMKHLLRILILSQCLAPLLAAAAGPAPAPAGATASRSALPARELMVEMRQIEAAQTGYAVGTQSAAPLLVPQQLQVSNGKPARFSLGQTQSLQWVQAVSAGGTLSGPSVKQSLVRMESGQSLSVLPRWPGGKQDVAVEIELQASQVGDRVGTELPVQTQSHLSTTLTLPLGQWTTIASTGTEAPRGVYRSDAATPSRRLLQLRVTAP